MYRSTRRHSLWSDSIDKVGQSTTELLNLFGGRSDQRSKVMGKNDNYDFNLFYFLDRKWAGSAPGKGPGWPPRRSLKYGPDTTSSSKVIEFTVNDFFGTKWEKYSPLSPPLVVFSNRKKRHRNSVEMTNVNVSCRLSSISQTKSRRFSENRCYTSSDLGRALPETKNLKWIRYSHFPQWRHQRRKNRKTAIFESRYHGESQPHPYFVVSKGVHPPSSAGFASLSRRPSTFGMA